MPRKNLLDILLDIGKSVTQKIINALDPIFGFTVDIYYPLSDEPDSVYGSDDNKYRYARTPNETDRYIVLNLFDEDFNLSDLTYDPFPTSQAYVLTHGEKVIPKNAKLIIYKGNSHYKSRVVSHKVLNGRNGPIFVKNLIVPFT